jgi:hypothetical protein
MESLKFHLALLFYTLQAGHPINGHFRGGPSTKHAPLFTPLDTSCRQPEALKMFLLRTAQNLKLSSTQHRQTAWGVQKGRRRLQLAHPVGGPPL